MFFETPSPMFVHTKGLGPNFISGPLPPQEPCAPLFKSLIGHDNIKALPRDLRRKCARKHWELNSIHPFQFAMPGIFRPRLVRDPARLMRNQGTYRIAEFLFSGLLHPPAGLRHLTRTVLKLQGGEKITLVLERRPHRRYAGQFRYRRKEIRLADTLSRPRRSKSGWGHMDGNTLYHEIGHNLMYLLYGGRFPAYRGPAHDRDERDPLGARTSPGAAWSEGFANGISLLDYGAEWQIDAWDMRTEVGRAWLRRPLEERLRNEYVIGTILGEYLKSQVPREQEGRTDLYVLFDSESRRRFDKVVHTMRVTGLHRDFGEFLADFSHRHPEEMERLAPILGRFGLTPFIAP